MGDRAFNKIQYGKETTRGTAVAATKMLVGGEHPPVKPDRVPRFPAENLGVRAESMRSWIGQFLVADSIVMPDAYFQAMPLIFSLGLKGAVVAAEQTGGQADYLWTFTPSLSAVNAPDTITLEVGDDVQAYEAEYVMIERIRIAGQINQGPEASPEEVSFDYFARQWTPTTFTGALSLPTVEPINAKLARFYLDTTWAGVGGTEKTGLLREYEIEILTGNHHKMHGGANKFFDTHAEGLIAVMANFTFEGNSDADAIWDAYRSQALAVARLEVQGAQIGTGVNFRRTIDIGGKWEEVTPISSIDKGNNLHTARLHGIYDTTGAKKLQVAVVTNANTI